MRAITLLWSEVPMHQSFDTQDVVIILITDDFVVAKIVFHDYDGCKSVTRQCYRINIFN